MHMLCTYNISNFKSKLGKEWKVCHTKQNWILLPQNHAVQHILECVAAHCLSNLEDHPDLRKQFKQKMNALLVSGTCEFRLEKEK